MLISLFVCLSVCSHILKTRRLNFSEFAVYLLPVAVTWSSSDFVDDVVVSYNGGNRPESKTTRMFRTARQVAAPGRSLQSLRLNCSVLISKVTAAT